jgi:hypothetical protein
MTAAGPGGPRPRRPRVLATARHPGPVHCVAALAEALPGLDWVIAASGAAAAGLAAWYPALGQRVTVLGADAPDGDWAAHADPADLPAARTLLAACRRLADRIQPDLVVRTTPATGFGADELIGTAVAGRAPVLCIQDFPGLGLALGGGQHPVATATAAEVATVDATSAGWIERRHAVPARVLGWIAHERLARFPAYSPAREAARAGLGVGGQKIALLVGSSSDVAVGAEAAMITAACGLARLAALRPLRLAYRAHPRRSAAQRERLQRTFAAAAGASALAIPRSLAEAALLALPDVVVSRASVLNLEVLAYAGTAGDVRAMPISVYCGADAPELFPGYWGPQPPVTHQPGGGSVIAAAGTLAAAVAAALGQRETLAAAALAYRPRGAAAERGIQDWLGRRAARC